MSTFSKTDDFDETKINRLRKTLFSYESMNVHKSKPKKDSEMVNDFVKQIKLIVLQGGSKE